MNPFEYQIALEQLAKRLTREKWEREMADAEERMALEEQDRQRQYPEREGG